jgi:hypothetical protein
MKYSLNVKQVFAKYKYMGFLWIFNFSQEKNSFKSKRLNVVHKFK